MDITLLCYLKLPLLFTGMFPYKMVTTSATRYAFYRNISHAIYFLFLVSLYLEVPYVWSDGSQIIECVNKITTYTVLAWKVYICKSDSFADLICEMAAMEDKIATSGDTRISDVYRRYSTRAKYVQLYNIYVDFGAMVLYIIPYIYKYLIAYQDVGEERMLPYRMWMPFDKTDHYVVAFAVNFYFLFGMVVYYFTAPMLIITLLLYTSFRLEILGHFLKNIKTYKDRIRENEEDDAVERVIRFCVLEHLKIIKIVDTLNYCLKNVTMIEFILLSAQIALILFEGFTSDSSNIVITSILHVTLILVQMLLYYWHADEIRHESVSISEALYETDWYEYNTSTKRTIQIMMVRSQRPLSLTVGPFGDMSLTMALKILKGVYTYATFLQHSYGNKSASDDK